ncbi:F-box/WD-40 repeat-containing protein At3g52030 [Malania oleifera]|uniref:F-box/WD-40 repeat-containing protein At3g52030 n=1 Tax=Malania oleifera TaxID=397392 RepID=UPI0025AE75FA|nr:F-box/WD-40 repeat-containing protein At3g52030 [Malania oleifera]
MRSAAAGDGSPSTRRRSKERRASRIQVLDHDILCMVFALLDLFDLVRCSAVCKSWNTIINRSKMLQMIFCEQNRGSTARFNLSNCSEESFKIYIEELAMQHHKLSLEEGVINVDQWKGHSTGVDQCRMKMGLILTGVGDQVMRLWSLESYKCLEEYSMRDMAPLVDFDFDESKIVSLVGTNICIWRRNGKRSVFPSREGTFTKGLCMRYLDPEAVVGCEDGTARVFDMYSRKCSRIIRMHAGPITCLSLNDDQLILSGSSLGSITISGLSSDQRVATLRSTNSTGIRTLYFNHSSHLVFSGSTAGYAACWDLRTMRSLWERRVSPNIIYSMQTLQNDVATLVVGGIDGVLRILDQNTGSVLSSCVMEDRLLPSSSRNTPVLPSYSKSTDGIIERRKGRRLSEDTCISRVPRSTRPPITCLAVGMKKVVTTHNGKHIRLWKFNKQSS